MDRLLKQLNAPAPRRQKPQTQSQFVESVFKCGQQRSGQRMAKNLTKGFYGNVVQKFAISKGETNFDKKLGSKEFVALKDV